MDLNISKSFGEDAESGGHSKIEITNITFNRDGFMRVDYEVILKFPRGTQKKTVSGGSYVETVDNFFVTDTAKKLFKKIQDKLDLVQSIADAPNILK